MEFIIGNKKNKLNKTVIAKKMIIFLSACWLALNTNINNGAVDMKNAAIHDIFITGDKKKEKTMLDITKYPILFLAKPEIKE